MNKCFEGVVGIGQSCFRVYRAEGHCCYHAICERHSRTILAGGGTVLAQGYPKFAGGRSLVKEKCGEVHKFWKHWAETFFFQFLKSRQNCGKVFRTFLKHPLGKNVVAKCRCMINFSRIVFDCGEKKSSMNVRTFLLLLEALLFNQRKLMLQHAFCKCWRRQMLWSKVTERGWEMLLVLHNTSPPKFWEKNTQEHDPTTRSPAYTPTFFWQTFWHSSGNSFSILSDDISSGKSSEISSGISFGGICHNLLTFFS